MNADKLFKPEPVVLLGKWRNAGNRPLATVRSWPTRVPRNQTNTSDER